MIKYTVRTQRARERLERLRAALSPEAIDAMVDRAAFEIQASLIRATPKKWFGQVRRGWIVVKPAVGVRVIVNQNPIMLFLEEGTKDHGPKNAIVGPLRPGQTRGGGKALFIPLTRKAVNATAGFFGVGPVPVRTVTKTFIGPVPHVAGIVQRTQSIRKGKVKTSSRNLLYGTDYVLAKRVRGIRARHIAAKQRTRAKALLKKYMKAMVRQAIKES